MLGTQVCLSSCYLACHVSSLNLMPDRSGERFFHITVPWWGTIVGYIICLSTPSVGGRYVGMFLMASGYAGKQRPSIESKHHV